MMKALGTIIVLILITVAVVGYALYQNQQPQAPTESLSQPSTSTTSQAPLGDIPRMTTIATGLEVPWALAFLPNGDLLVTERYGAVRVIRQNGGLDPVPLLTINDVRESGEGGLHGIALHPSFPQEPYVYLYYTYGTANNTTLNRVVRYRFDNGQFTNREVIVDQIPGASNHDGGRIKFGPDNFLYITTGDAQNPSLAQDRNSLAGKVLRVTSTGEAAADNPFGNRAYSFGHRNPQGITWDASGNLWETEHGPSGIGTSCCRDELNLIQSGQNYGWPTITGDQIRSGMVSAILQSGNSTTWAPGDIAFLNDRLYFTGLRGQALYEVPVHGATVGQLSTHFQGELGRIREVVTGPDNMLYITTSNRDGRGSPAPEDDRVIRINPSLL